jgi:hypothetical protein
MKTRLLIVPLLALVTASAPAAIVARADETSPAATAPTAPTTLRIRGVIRKYDADTRTLSLMTAGGALRIQLAPAVRIRYGGSEIDAKALETFTGHRAAVRYSESGGVKTAESIHVFARNERTDR